MNYPAVANLTLGQFLARVWPAWGMVSGVDLGWDITTKGWPDFGDKWLKPCLDKGWTNAFFHRPNGDDSNATGEPMNRDARVEALQRRQGYVYGQPVLLDKAHAQWGLRRVINYHGSSWDPDFRDLLNAGHIAEWIDRHRRSILPDLNRPYIEPAFDHDATMHGAYESRHNDGFPPGAWELNWAWSTLVIKAKALTGTRVWIESIIERAAPHQYGCNFICTTSRGGDGQLQSEFLRKRPLGDPFSQGQRDNGWAADSRDLTGEALDWNKVYGRDPLSVYAPAIADVLARGPQWHWAGAVFYLRESAEQVWRYVVDYAAARGDGDN